MTTADEKREATGGVVAGFFSFTEITDPNAHRAYNAWHQLDHLPEQMPLAGIAHGERWVVSPRCRAARHVGSGDFAEAHYLTLYLMHPPLRETIDSFYALAMRLHDEDRFFAHRRPIATGALLVRQAHAAPRVRISAAALPYRPNRGVYAVVQSRSKELSGEQGRALPDRKVHDLLEIPGVAGVWTFGQATVVSGDAAIDDGRTVTGPPGSGRSLDALVTICFLDDDPVSVSGAIEDVLLPDWERDAFPPDIAGPLEAIVPWSWDWFD